MNKYIEACRVNKIFFKLGFFILTVAVVGCSSSASSGGGSSDGSQKTTNELKVIINPMSTVPVLDGSPTQTSFIVHNYGSQVANGLTFSVVPGNESAGNKFEIKNVSHCQIIPANSSCQVYFKTPALKFGAKGSSLIKLNYRMNNKTIATEQIINYQYVGTNAQQGVHFLSKNDVVTGPHGGTVHATGYLYAAGNDLIYKNVRLVSNTKLVSLYGGFTNGQEVASGEVIPVEFVATLENDNITTAEVVPSWGDAQLSNKTLRNNPATQKHQLLAGSSNSGALLTFVLRAQKPSTGVVNFVFDSIPQLTAPNTDEVLVKVINSGNIDSTAGVTAVTDNPALLITNNCTSSILKAYAANYCSIGFKVSEETSGQAMVTFKDSSGNPIGTSQIVQWVNNSPEPVINAVASVASISLAKYKDSAANGISFIVSNSGKAALQGAVFNVSLSGPATWVQDSTTCGQNEDFSSGASCVISGHLHGNNDGNGKILLNVSGQLADSSVRNYIPAIIDYQVQAGPILEITPTNNSVNMTVLANEESMQTVVFNIANTGDDPALIESLYFNYRDSNLESNPVIGATTCGSTLNEGESCAVTVTYGPVSYLVDHNESGVASLNVYYHGGTPDVYSTAKNDMNYYLIGNDAYLDVSNLTATNLGGTGVFSDPFMGYASTDGMKISFVYINKSQNYMMQSFALDTSALPVGLQIDTVTTTCPYGASAMNLAAGDSCTFAVLIDRNILTNNIFQGAVNLDFARPAASWSTPLGYYYQDAFVSEGVDPQIRVTYNQPVVSSVLSPNGSAFESAVLSISASNLNYGSGSLVVHVSGVKNQGIPQLPVGAGCLIAESDFSADCTLDVANPIATIKYVIEPVLFGNDFNIPLLMSIPTNSYAYMGTNMILLDHKAGV